MSMNGYPTLGVDMGSVLLDTSFLVRLLSDQDPLHNNAKGYFKYFLEEAFITKVSTISIAEYCVGGKIDELPLKNLQIVPFNSTQAIRTSEFVKVIFQENKTSSDTLRPRAIIPNDSKLFAQADLDQSIRYFVTSDFRSKKTYKKLKKQIKPRFQILNIAIPYHEPFGTLNLR